MSADTADAKAIELAALLRVIADENRLRILELLAQREMCVCEIMERLALPQPLASHHLGVLRQAGLVCDRRDAQWVYYSIAPERLAELNARYTALLDVSNLKPESAYGAAPHRC